MRLMIIISSLFLITACGQNFSGTYENKFSEDKFIFKNNGECIVKEKYREEVVCKFKRDGDTLKVEFKNGGEVLGIIQNPDTLKLKKTEYLELIFKKVKD